MRMDGFLKEILEFNRPLLVPVQLREVLHLAQNVRQTNLVVGEVEGKVSRVAVGDGGYVFQSIAEHILQYLAGAVIGAKYQCAKVCLCNP